MSRDAAPPTLSALPYELLAKILAYTMASNVPVDLQGFIELAGPSVWLDPPQEFYHRVPTRLAFSQRPHYLDWLAVNRTCRRFRDIGKLAYFSAKIFVIKPSLLKALKGGSCRNISKLDQAAIISNVRHVVAPLPTSGIAGHFLKVTAYNAFTRLRVLSVLPLRNSFKGLTERALKSASTPMASEPVPWGSGELDWEEGTLKRHSAPQELLGLLHGVKLRVEHLDVDLVHCDTIYWRRYIIDRLTSEVYPFLTLIGEYKRRERLVKDRESSASV